MNTPVSFPIARLLKEKGFDLPTLIGYISEGIPYQDEPFEVNYNAEPYSDSVYSAPTISEVVMWIYKKYGIWIKVECDVYGKEWYSKLSVASKELWEDLDKRHAITVAHHNFRNITNSPEEAYEAAIEYTLKNLI